VSIARTSVPITVAFVLALGLAGCGIAARPAETDLSAPSAGPATTPGPAAAQTGELVRTTLRSAGFQLGPPQVPFRPAESPRLAAAARRVFQVQLAEDPTHGYIVVYELPDPAAAANAGREQAEYLATGPGRIQFPPDSRHVLRRVGTTLVFYSWSPVNSPAERVPRIADALATVGEEIPIVR
jgi:hypothetical protein